MSLIKTMSIRMAVLVAALALVVVVLGALGANSAGVASAADPTPCPQDTTHPALPTNTPAVPSPTPAPGNPPQCLGPIKIPAVAQVGTTSGSGPTLTFECKWEAPDMSPYDAPMTYGSTGAFDDNPWVTADSACDPSHAPVNNSHHTMGIVANAEDQPQMRQYEKYVAIQSNNPSTDIIDVYFKVWEPYVASPPNGPNCGPDVVINGVTYTSQNPSVPIEGPFASDPAEARWCLEEQHHATPTMGAVTPDNPLQSVPCTVLQANTAMFAQAIGNGDMTAAERDNMINNCFQGGKRIFKVLDQLPKDKPCGEVRVEATAINSAGNPVHLANYFDNICFIHLQLDFTSVNWGTLDANGGAVVLGDTAYGTGGPTVLNTGNAPMYVETMFDPLVLAGDPTKTITSFDSKVRAAWQTDPSTLQVEDPQPANMWMCFNQHPIGSDQTGKIDFSVHTTAAQTGSYTGAVYVVARFNCDAPHSPLPQLGPTSWTLHPNTPAGGH